MALNVLVVDDSAVMRGIIIKTLRLSGLPLSDVHQAANGEEGLKMLDQHWVDLVMVDINMPVMNGEEMLDRAPAGAGHLHGKQRNPHRSAGAKRRLLRA